MTLIDFLRAPEQQQFDHSVALLRSIEQWKRLSRTDAARLCGLNTATMTHLSASLLGSGLLRERGKAQSTAGRKPTFLELEPAAGHSIVLHLMPGRTQLTMHNLHHQTVSALRLPAAGNEEVLQACLDAIPSRPDILGGCIVHGHDCLPDPALATRFGSLWQQQADYPVYMANAASMTCLAESHLCAPDQDATLLTLAISAHHVTTGLLLGSQLLFDGPCPGLMSRRPGSVSGGDLCLNSLSFRACQHDAARRGAAAFHTAELLASPSPCAELCRLALEGNSDAACVLSGYAEALAWLMDDLFRLYQPDMLILDGEILHYMEVLSPMLHARLQDIASPALAHVHTPLLGSLSCTYGASRLCLRRAMDQIPHMEKEVRP